MALSGNTNGTNSIRLCLSHESTVKEADTPMPNRSAFRTKRPGQQGTLSADDVRELDAALGQVRERLGALDRPNQVLGKGMSIGCVALEVTQRCNLDCQLCYLSENSEAVRDLPIEELFRRLDEIRKHYGIGANVQITGGDPTLRKHHELIKVVRYARELGLMPALFTNGIAASRMLLESLVDGGLSDVAFHVDLTQKRPGYDSELALNAVREAYIERARGLPIMVTFNTTVHRANFDAIPLLVKFFADNADVVGMASFQLQADTGRGALRGREHMISLETVRGRISEGAGCALPWDTVLVGHPQCHSYIPTLVLNGKVHEVIDDPALFGAFLSDFGHLKIDRRLPVSRAAWMHIKAARAKPIWYWRAVRFGLAKLWALGPDLIAARGRVHKLTFFVQNFMDAENLDDERIEACSFMVMTPDGPMSMCAHNARRDEFILRPIEVKTSGAQTVWFDPLKPPGRKRKGEGNRANQPDATSGSASRAC